MNRLLPANGPDQAPFLASPRSRREFLAALVVLPLLPAAGLVPRAADTVATAPAQPLARLGARLAAADPALTRLLARDVDTWVEANCRETRAGARLAAARRALLAPDRLADDYARRRIVRIDGWILSRSEAAVCAYAHVQSGLAPSSV